MEIIKHRVNTVEELKRTPVKYGVEIDLRSWNDELILHHDAFNNGDSFDYFLSQYNHKTLILNTKSEGLEESILKLLDKYSIGEYFFLDLSLPFLVKYCNSGHKRIAVRFSEYEPIEYVMKFAGKVDWVWVDCFNYLPLNQYNFTVLKRHFKLCIVSPELQGFSKTRINEFKEQLNGLKVDAVCTKFPSLWI